jgi:hypothetical protein
MSTRTKKISNTESMVTREYVVKGTKYIVTATVRDGVSQDAATIVRRLIQKDILAPVNSHQ